MAAAAKAQDGVLITFAVGADDGKLTLVGEPLDLHGAPALRVGLREGSDSGLLSSTGAHQ